MNPLDFLLGKRKPASRGSVPGFPPPPKGRFPASFGAPRVPITSAATGTSSLLGPVATLADIYYQGSKVFNPKDNIITSIQDLSTSIGNQFAKPGQEGRYVGSNPIAVRANRELDSRNRSYYGPAYAGAEALGLGGSAPSLRNYGPGYKEKELAAGAAAERFRPGAGFPGQQGAADRAYQQEKARVTQMTEQDPMFKKYKVAELTKAYNTASPEEKNKIGLQIWATTNPELAAKLKPGQTGYQEAYDLLGTQTFGTGQPVSTKVNFEQSTEKAGAPTPELPTGFAQAYTNPVPNFGMGINMQQTAYAPEGQSAPEMVSPDFSNVPLMSPPKELVDLMKNRAFKQAFESRIK